MSSTTIIIEGGFLALVLLTHAGGLGVVRMLLAMLVVGSHVGGLGDTSAGGAGIGGFFAISGYLMARTIEAHYQGTGFGRFYLNRFIRLAPPLVAAMGLTVLLLYMRDGEGFRVTAHGSGRFMPVEFPPSFLHWFNLGMQPYPVFLVPSFYTLPQAWSLVTEGCFYLVAPLAAWFLFRRAGAVVMAGVAASTVLAIQAVAIGSSAWLRSPVASFWIFGMGMLIFRWSRKTPVEAAAARRLRWTATATLGALVLLTFGHLPVGRERAELVTPLLMLAWLWLIDTSRHVPARWGSEAGNWAYGVFLGHFLSTMGMYWVAEAVFRATGVFGVFGDPDDAPLRLALFTYLFALLTGIGLYYLVERPFERVRAAVRTRTFAGLMPLRPAVPLADSGARQRVP